MNILKLFRYVAYYVNSNGGSFHDEDDECYLAEHGWVAGIVDNQDWANPGKQSKTKY